MPPFRMPRQESVLLFVQLIKSCHEWKILQFLRVGLFFFPLKIGQVKIKAVCTVVENVAKPKHCTMVKTF